MKILGFLGTALAALAFIAIAIPAYIISRIIDRIIRS